MLATVLHLSVATHVCCGKIQSSQISVTGKITGCGMENDEIKSPASDFQFVNHCCDNKITFYGITSNFFPSFSVIPEVYQQVFQNSFVVNDLNIPDQIRFNICKNESPPGAHISSVDLTSICIFRI